MSHGLALALVFMLGLLTGSFLGAAAYRVPRGISLWWPPSRCPACGTRLTARDLVPVLSYVVHRGRCRHCAAPVSWRYTVMELAAGLLFAGAYAAATRGLQEPPAWNAFATAAVFASFLLVMTVIDLEHMRLPDKVNLAGAAAGFILSVTGLGMVAPGKALSGAALGFSLIVAVVLLSRGGMGMGDAKFLATIGTFVGPAGVVYTLLGASVLGAAVGLVLVGLGRRPAGAPIPFGPFLAAAAAVVWEYLHLRSL